MIDTIASIEEMSDTNQKETLLKPDPDLLQTTAAHLCAENGHVAILDKLIKLCKELPSTPDSEGNLPLHCLCKNTVSGLKDL